MKNSIFILLFFIEFFCSSQDKNFVGKIETQALLSNVLVVNLTKQAETKTDGFGRFSIKAEAGDLLVFSGEYVKRTRFLIESEHLERENIIALEHQHFQIETVTINKINISSEDLGLIPKGQKRYTQAERRLKTATDSNLEYNWLIPTISFSLDPLINSISGRTKKLKEQLDIEHFNQNMVLTESFLPDEVLIFEFGVPPNYTKSFRIFLVDNSDFLEVLQKGSAADITTQAFVLVKAFEKNLPQE